MAVDNEEIALATANLFQCVYDSLSGGDSRNYGKEEALVLGKRRHLNKYKFRATVLKTEIIRIKTAISFPTFLLLSDDRQTPVRT